MTQEQFEKIQPYLKEKGINIDRGLMCELEDKIKEAIGSEQPLLMIEKGHMRYDPHYERELMSNIIAMMFENMKDNSICSLEKVFITIAGYLIAADSTRADFEEELFHFVQYCKSVRKSLVINDAPNESLMMTIKKPKHAC